MNIIDMTIHELHAALKGKQLSSVEATTAMLARIAAVEPQVGSFITVTSEQALAAAAAADQIIAAGGVSFADRYPAGA